MPDLSHEACERLFPFHVALDAELRVSGLGRSLRRLLPAEALGQPFAELFVVERPVLPELTLPAMLARQDVVWLVAVRGRELRLRGELVTSAGGAMFAGSPWLTDLAQVAQLVG